MGPIHTARIAALAALSGIAKVAEKVKTTVTATSFYRSLPTHIRGNFSPSDDGKGHRRGLYRWAYPLRHDHGLRIGVDGREYLAKVSKDDRETLHRMDLLLVPAHLAGPTRRERKAALRKLHRQYKHKIAAMPAPAR